MDLFLPGMVSLIISLIFMGLAHVARNRWKDPTAAVRFVYVALPTGVAGFALLYLSVPG